MSDLQLLDLRDHRDLRLDLANAGTRHFVQIVSDEVPVAALEYPILFAKNPETGAFYAGAVFGLEAGTNLFAPDGLLTGYRPADLVRQGFFLNDGRIAIAPGDPVHSLIDLFAWYTETILYRANLIPERQRRVFLNLLQIPVRPARPARGVVCVDAGALPEVVPGDCGRHVRPNDGAAMAAGVRDLFEHDDPAALGRRARAHVETRHSWDAVAESLVGHYRRVLGDHEQPVLASTHESHS